MSDGTAMGVAKIRFMESLLPPEKRVVDDPFAAWMFPGSSVMNLMGFGVNHWLFDKVCPGLFELIAARSAHIDAEVLSSVKVSSCESQSDEL